MSCPLTLLIVSLDTQGFHFDEVQFIYFLLLCLCYWYHKSTAKSKVIKIYPHDFSKGFMALAFIFRSLIHSELIFIYAVK